MVTTKYIKSVLQKLNAKKTAGTDSIPPKFVKLAAQPLSQLLTEAINMGIEQKIIFQAMLKLHLSSHWTKVNQINMICQVLDQSAT